MRLFWCKNDVITIFVLFTLNIKIHILCSFGVFDCFSLVKNNISQTYDYLIMKILEKLSQIFLWFPDKNELVWCQDNFLFCLFWVCLFITMMNERGHRHVSLRNTMFRYDENNHNKKWESNSCGLTLCVYFKYSWCVKTGW